MRPPTAGAPVPRAAPRPEPVIGGARTARGSDEDFSAVATSELEIVNRPPKALRPEEDELVLSTGDFEAVDKQKPPRP
ncbi:MAG: hypothetical protein HYV09_29145 [Deltaproteobacteria bacterium]|nr:hypothetical protein [Deltaproteobacteria bacterium]